MYSLHVNMHVMVSTEYHLVHFLKSYSTEHGVVKPYLYMYSVVHGAFVHTYLLSTFKWETAYNKCDLWIVHVCSKPQLDKHLNGSFKHIKVVVSDIATFFKNTFLHFVNSLIHSVTPDHH